MDTQTINFDTKSQLAKLIATENISVQHNNVQTASFDTKNRILTLPTFKKPKGDVYDMLIAHECSHALYTPFEGWKSICDDDELRTYVNVLEDCRIDKLIQKKYPGVVKNYLNGFDILNKQNFFGTKGKDINKDLMLIDKINMYYKSSKRLPFHFSSFDVKWLDKVDSMKSFDDVVNLAKELLDWQKKEVKKMKKLPDFDLHKIAENYNLSKDDSNDSNETQSPSQSQSCDEGDKSEDKDTDNKQSMESNDEKKEESNESMGVTNEAEIGGGSGVKPGQLTSITNQSLENKKSELYNSEVGYSYYGLPQPKLNKLIISNKQFIKDMRSYAFNEMKGYASSRTYYNWLQDAYKKFKKDNSKTVMYLVKEFEMKKSAQAYKKASTDKTGVIDPLKLKNYKFSDDIFKRLTILPNEKNHGMMMLLDWSGSMCSQLKQTVEQLMNLVWFCQKVNIPFEVYFFTSEYTGKKGRMDDAVRNGSDVFKYKFGDAILEQVNLVSIAHNGLKKTQLDESLMWLWHMSLQYADRYTRSYDLENDTKGTPFYMPTNYYLGSTPLNQALVAFEKMIPMFKSKNRVEKMSIITLTDGGANWSFGEIYGSTKKMNGKPIIKVDNKQYTITDEQNQKYYSNDTYTGLLLDIIRKKHNVKTIGFYVTTRTRGWELERFTRGTKDYEERARILAKMKEQMSKEKFTTVDNIGYTKYFLLNGKKMKVENTDLSNINDKMKAGGIARVFKKSMKGRITSRTLLNQFIQEVA